MSPENPEARMGILEHLEELRQVLFTILKGVVVGSILGLLGSEYLLKFFMQLAENQPVEFIMIAPTEGFMVQIRLGILAGVALSLPNSLLGVWNFMAPGLLEAEKRYFFWCFPALFGLFALGAWIALEFVIPSGLKFLLGFQIADVKPQLSIEKYISFCSTVVLVFGGAFELPVALVILNRLGVLPLVVLRKFRKHTVVAAFVAAAVLTPPDVVTQTLLAIPLVGLYELTLFFLGLWEKKEDLT